MEQNEYREYSTYQSRTAQQMQSARGQLAERPTIPQPVVQNKGLPQQQANQKPKVVEKMPKARALALANSLKKGVAVTSILGFGAVSGLIAWQQISPAITSATSTSSSSSQSTSSSSQNSGFFNQQGNNGSNFGTSNSSSSSTSQFPVSTSRTS